MEFAWQQARPNGTRRRFTVYATAGGEAACVGGDPNCVGGDPAYAGGEPTLFGGVPALVGDDPSYAGDDQACLSMCRISFEGPCSHTFLHSPRLSFQIILIKIG